MGIIALLAACGVVLYVGIADLPPAAHAVGRALWLWGALCLAVGAGPILSRGRIPGERYLSDGALPIYVLHHLPLVVIGYFAKDLPWPILQRYVVIVLGAFLVTLAIYHTLVRPFDLARVALGMAPRATRRRPRELPATGDARG